MSIKKLFVIGSVALAALFVGGAVVGAQAGSSSNAPAEEQQGVDTDDIQEGDQSGADGATEANEPEGKEGTEGPGESDGPGGHEDSPGDAEHEFDGEE